MDAKVRLAAAPHAVFRKLGGAEGGVLVHLVTTGYFHVNELGATIWELLGEEPTFMELITCLRSELEDAPADLEREVGAFVGELISRGLVVEQPVN